MPRLNQTGGKGVQQWSGRISNADPHDITPGGAQLQDNMQCLKPGALSVRRGTLKSADLSGSTSYDILSLWGFLRPEGDVAISVDANGVMRYRRSGTATSLETGLSTFGRWSFERDRRGNMIGVNGIDRGVIWDGLESSPRELGIDAPTNAATFGTGSGGNATAGDYVAAYRFIDETEPTNTYSSLSPVSEVTATAGQKFTYSGLDSSSQDRVTKVQIWRSTAGAPNVLYLIEELAEGGSPADDTNSDQALIDAAVTDPNKVMRVLNPNGSVNGRRQNPPPNFKSVVKSFQDRYWYAADVEYNAGTVSTTSSDATITGSGTAWTDEMAGRFIYIDGYDEPVEISSVTNGTSLEATATLDTSLSGKAYAIRPTPDERNVVYFSEQDEPESVPATNFITIQENTDDDDEIVGLMPFGSILYVLKNRHIYSLSFVRQPQIDVDVRLLTHRGAFNARCYDFHEGVAYLMDDSGCYKMTPGGGIQPISGPVQDLFREDIDYSKKKWFHVSVDPTYELAYFFVALSGDSGDRPGRAIVYNLRTGQLWTESYADDAGDSSKIEISGKLRVIVGGEDDRVLVMNGSETDVVSSHTRGTATGGSTTTINDSGAAFGTSSELVGAPVAIASGTGKGQLSKVTSHTNTQLTISPALTTAPSTDSVYLVGAIEYQYKSGLFELEREETDHERGLEVVFQPTTNDNNLVVSTTRNHDSTADSSDITTDGNQFGGNLSRTEGSTDGDVDLKLADSIGNNRAGWTYNGVHGRWDHRTQGYRWITYEFSGFKGDDPITIYAAGVLGAA